MKLNIIITLLFALIINKSMGQNTSEEVGVTETIKRLFKGMELGDSTMVHSTFTQEVTFATIFRDKSNNVVLHRENSPEGFLKAVGTPHKEVWYEEIWNLKIQIDGDFSQAWCDYAFYADKNFSHCGADAFHLIKQKEGWLIFHLADTRRKIGCTIPQNIQDKHK
jgi:hypothetical protein